jgi:hypothetical protein
VLIFVKSSKMCHFPVPVLFSGYISSHSSRRTPYFGWKQPKYVNLWKSTLLCWFSWFC